MSTVIEPTARAAGLSGSPDAEDVTLKMLRLNLRRGQMGSLGAFIVQAGRKASASSTDKTLAAWLRYESGRAARALGKLDAAEEFLSRGLAGLPAGSLELLAAINRLSALIMLDRERTAEARRIAEEADGLEYERVSGAERLVHTSDSSRSPETLALLAEIALAEGDTEAARRHIDGAARRLSEERARAGLDAAGALAQFDPDVRRAVQREADVRDHLRCLEAVWQIRNGEESHGQSLLGVLIARLGLEASPDAALVARATAARGEWLELGESTPPPDGINIFEARRWYELGQTPPPQQSVAVEEQAEPAAVEMVSSPPTPQPLPSPAALDTPAPLPAAARPEAAASAVSTEEVVETVAGRILDVLERAAANRAEPPQQVVVEKGKGSAFGGVFTDYDLLAQLTQAERNRMTGYVHATWDPAALEGMIAGGHIHEMARAGTGWVFVRDGLITDAAIGTMESAGQPDAREILLVLVQIGIGLGLNPTGEGYGYRDASVQERPARLEIWNNEQYALSLIHEYERRMELKSGGGGRREEEEAAEEPAFAPSALREEHAEESLAVTTEQPKQQQPEEEEGATRAAVATPGGASLFLSVVTATTQKEMAAELCGSLSAFGAPSVVVSILSGERPLTSAHTRPWGAGERGAARAHIKVIEVGGGISIEVGTSAELPADALQALLEIAALRFRTMPGEEPASPCFTTCASPDIVIASTKMRAVYDRVAELSRGDAPVLIAGETGTGKELVAKRIHELSGRAGGTWLPINLSGMPRELVRSELFGHARGAFSGADKERVGALRQAEGGTLLLDEFGEIDFDVQGILLRAMEERLFTRLGESRPTPFDVRLIFATNRPIDDAANFRADIKFRCEVIRIPPLRERPEDIRPLALFFARQVDEGVEFAEAALAFCEGRTWRGNVRHLRTVIRQVAAAAAAGSKVIDLEKVEEAEAHFESEAADGSAESTLRLPGEKMVEAVERIRKTFLARALAEAGPGRGQINRAAEIYGATRQTFKNHLKKYDLTGEE